MSVTESILDLQGIDPVMPVVFDREVVGLRMVPLGREFRHNGRLYQASIGSTVRIDQVRIKARFRFHGIWLIRQNTGAYQLARNMPFGPVTSQHEYMLEDTKVQLLEINDRGPA